MAMEYRLPRDKVLKIKSNLEVIQCRKKFTLRDLLSLIGLLALHVQKLFLGGHF